MKLRILILAIAFWSGAPLLMAQPADYIVAVVNSEPITNSEVRSEVQRVLQRLTQQRQTVPAADVLRKEVLEHMINDRAQLQLARDTGIKVDEASINLAEENVARQNLVDVAEMRRRLAKDGTDVATFRGQLRDQLILTRLQERDVESRVRISETEIDRYLLEQQKGSTDPFAQEINLAQILIATPENGTTEQVAVLQQQAEKALERLRTGEDFSALVQELSAAQKDKGGQLGLRRADRYPRSFVLATQNLDVGGVSQIVRSAAGFHILKVIEKRAPSGVIRTVVQTRARHVLLRTGPQLTQEEAVARLAAYKKRILAGTVTLASVAREYSQDGSASDGGDLGWAMPGMFVPEFEDAMSRLADGDISDPVVSRFGVHLIQVVERRRVELDPLQLRESIRNELRATRAQEAYTTWAQDIRARAFVDYRDPPQ